MKYKLRFKRSARKQLFKIPNPYYKQLVKLIESLTENPRPKGAKKLKGRDGWRVRQGNYRVIYEVDDEILIITVIAIGHRQGIY